jgi:O-antigen/teichoic acid export membrane protein
MGEREKKVLNNLLKGAGFTVMGLFFSKAMGFLYRIIVGRYIGPEAYGQLSIGIMILGFAKAFSGGFLESALKKYIPEFLAQDDKGSIKGIVISSVGITILISLLVGFGIFFSAEFIATEFFGSAGLTWIIQTFGLLTIISSPYDRLMEATVGFNTAKWRNLIPRVFQNIVQVTAALIIVILLGKGLEGAVLSWIIATILSTVAAFYVLEKKLGPVILSNVKAKYRTKEILVFSYPLLLSGVIGTAQNWSDTALIGYFMTESAVGLYNAAFPIAMLVTIPAQALGALALSSLAELSTKEESVAVNSLKTITNWSFALVFPAFLLLALFPREVILLLFGGEYTSVALVIPILAFGNLFTSSIGKLGDFLQTKEHTKLMFYNTATTMILNVALNILLIPKMGVLGAGIATSTSMLLGVILLLTEGYIYEGITPFHKNMVKTIFSGVLAVIGTYLAVNAIFQPTPLWALFPAGIFFMTIHLLTFARIGGLEEYEKEIIITSSRKIGLEEETRKILETITP